MSDPSNIIEVTRENIQQVMQASFEVPVVMDFWAEWCQPCRTLMPLLAQLAEDYEGRFLLAKLNTEQQQEIAAHFGIRSIPVVKLFKDGQVADEFMGALPEAQIRQFLDRHIPRPSDGQLDAARQALSAGQYDQAQELLTQAQTEDPDNPRIPVMLAQAQAAGGDIPKARATLEALPAEQREQPDAQALLTRLEFADLLTDLPPPAELEQRLADNEEDHEARLQLALHMIAASRTEAGLDLLLDLMRRDREYDDDAARKTLIKVFGMLGDDPLVNRYRGRMANLLH